MNELLQLQIARDHLVMCQRRLEEGRKRPSRGYVYKTGMRLLELDVLQAIDFVWAAQQAIEGRGAFNLAARAELFRLFRRTPLTVAAPTGN